MILASFTLMDCEGKELAPRTLADCYTVYLLGVVLHVKSKITVDKKEKIFIMEKIDENKLLERKKMFKNWPIKVR